MITPSWDTLRLFLHVLAATVWVGGQITLALLVPALRPLGRDVLRTAGRRYRSIAWPAFGVLVLTGVWNMIAERAHDHGAYRTTLMIKLTIVLISGLAAFAHARARTPERIAALGAVSGLSALAALLFGILLAG